jgi:hypothetical protein
MDETKIANKVQTGIMNKTRVLGYNRKREIAMSRWRNGGCARGLIGRGATESEFKKN